MNEWINFIDPEELKYSAPPLFSFDNDPERAAIFMYREGYPSPMASGGDEDRLIELSRRELETRPPKKYWEQVKTEIHTLVCTSDEKYSELRETLNKAKENSTKYILTTIAGTVGGILGVEAGIISGFCAVLLHSLVKVGTEAYCALFSQSA